MRVAIAGAGSVGQYIAIKLLGNGHKVLLIDKDPRKIKVYNVPNAEWLLADACRSPRWRMPGCSSAATS